MPNQTETEITPEMKLIIGSYVAIIAISLFFLGLVVGLRIHDSDHNPTKSQMVHVATSERSVYFAPRSLISNVHACDAVMKGMCSASYSGVPNSVYVFKSEFVGR